MKKIFKTRLNLIESFNKDLIIVELGVFEGEFSKQIFEICKPNKLYLVDLFSGYFGSGDKDGKNYHYVSLENEMEKLKDFFKENDNVLIVKDSTTNFLNSLEDDSVDVVYIDADHSYNSVLNDLKISYLKVKNNGMICGHDYVKNTEAEKAVNDFCSYMNLNIHYLTEDGCPSFCIIK